MFNDTYYEADGYYFLIKYLKEYSDAHSWFHYYGTFIPDSNKDFYFHYVIVYWTDNIRPTLNTFNFIRLGFPNTKVQLNIEYKEYEDI